MKQGSLSASWRHEHGGVSGVSVASDPVHGALISAVLWEPEHVLGNLLSRTAGWVAPGTSSARSSGTPR